MYKQDCMDILDFPKSQCPAGSVSSRQCSFIFATAAVSTRPGT